ncbi:MAG: hypothetical protein LUO89_14025 [Methanothrix sp.]|nr:hypothetical protein [Methanothrix sp.]
MNESDTDNVLDLRVARWRHDPFIAEMLEIIEKFSRYDERKKEWALILMRVYLQDVEEEAAKRAKIKG